LSCTDLDLSLRPSCFTPGTLAGGAACARGSSCQSLVCSSGNNHCGTCVGTAIATGSSCAGTGCRGGDFCHPGTKLCTPESTIVHAGLGQPCDPAAVPSVGCAGDLLCVATDGGSAGTCEMRPATIVVGAGQTCDAVHVCDTNYVCFTILPGTVDASTSSTCVPIDLCAGTVCEDATMFCKMGDGGRYCAPKGAAGERCLGDGGTTISTCGYGLYCQAATGVCAAFGKQGDACDAQDQCAEYFLCMGGRCVPFSTAACTTPGPEGGAG